MPRPFMGLLATIEVVAIYTQQGLAWAVAIPVAGIATGLLIRWWMIRHGKLGAPDS